ncbi:hypothetical protein [Curtobacterium flaccumfaciens]|uniref:hypothetical protein n=1 Tax=Curtobacterium flaccumfaciens TaxID=2035 RepID=UPI001BDE012D|nr:hypothetical protein [Curtobacterium flaccumfaciens]MBT1630463.1 hypothetical protein [Curtobacterium flaccumfaciens pv. oortii]MCX2843942.1 hypothetical protein [Curtobacterium flaccumfaciens pv. oortii]
MVAKYSVRKSSYGDLRGVEQFVSTPRIALQVLSVMVDFNAWQKKRGAVGALSVNEGMRSRPRQSYLWNNRTALGVAVAPPFTSRHDEVRHGNALDFGITMPDGSNRALTPTEFAKLHELVEARGGTWTGVNFGEPWHHEMATRTERLAPYPDASVRAVSTAAALTAQPKPEPQQEPEPETLRRLLMAAADTITVYQRVGTNGKDQDTYFVAAPGVGDYLIRDGVNQPLALSIGSQYSGKEIRQALLDDGVHFEKVPAAQFDKTFAIHSRLAHLARGGKFGPRGELV